MVFALAVETKQRNRDYDAPISLLQGSVSRWPQGRAHFNLAFYLREAGRTDEAMAHLRAAVPDYFPAQFEVGSDLYNHGQFDEAVAQLRAFVGRTRSTSRRVMARNLIGLSLARQGHLPQAVDEFQAALQLDPDNSELHGNLAFMLLQQGDFEGARQHYEAYLARQKGSAFVLTNLGMALQELGRLERGGRAFPPGARPRSERERGAAQARRDCPVEAVIVRPPGRQVWRRLNAVVNPPSAPRYPPPTSARHATAASDRPT